MKPPIRRLLGRAKSPGVPGVQTWVKKLTEEIFGGAPFAVGDIVERPDGRRVKITDGQYWGKHGLSNFWEWREVKADGTLASKVESGYGWDLKKKKRSNDEREPRK